MKYSAGIVFKQRYRSMSFEETCTVTRKPHTRKRKLKQQTKTHLQVVIYKYTGIRIDHEHSMQEDGASQ